MARKRVKPVRLMRSRGAKKTAAAPKRRIKLVRREWNPANHPRGPIGRFIHKSRGE